MELDDTHALILGPAGRSLTPVPGAPRLSAASAALLREITAVDEQGQEQRLKLAIERPLTLIVDGREIVTLMTLGAAPEWLAIGYLRNHRLIDDVSTVRSIEVDWARGAAVVITRDAGLRAAGTREAGTREAEMRTAQMREPQMRGVSNAGASDFRGAAASLGCSLGTAFPDILCGAGADTAAAKGTVAHDALLALLESMRRTDAIHRAAGSVHSCALFCGSELWVAVEDVSRHNGVDTITGFMTVHGVDGADKILFSTGRLTGEMVLKAAHNGISIMVSRNGTTALGYELAAKLGMTLIGRAANRRYLCYIGAGRIRRDSSG